LTNTPLNGPTMVTLELPSGDRASVALQGAQVLSWQTSEGSERLYLSPKAIFDGRSAIRGGIPICFPQFNQRVLDGRALPKHGFARSLAWSVLEQSSEASIAEVKLGLDQTSLSPELRSLWPFKFEVIVIIRLELNRLSVSFKVMNRDELRWPFAIALHSYFKVPDIAQTRLQGLQSTSYWDAVQDLQQPEKRRQETGAELEFSSETDRVYESVPPSLELRSSADILKIEQSSSFSETVVWNPGEALCALLADMPVDGYRHMLCVEAAKINEAIWLEPGASWQGTQTLFV
jgi:glucose-6-phosphate 1-epimerase